MSWNALERHAVPNAQPEPIGQSLMQAILDIKTSTPIQGIKMSQIISPWSAMDIWHGIPEEFHGAELSTAIRQALKTLPISVALVGPPGVGKTRTLWAMVHAARKVKLGHIFGENITLQSLHAERETLPRIETRSEAVERHIKKVDRLKIIAEVEGIRRHRYDYAWLAEVAAYPHWLAIDDVGAIEPNEWVREAIYSLANERRAHQRPTIWTSNKTPGQLLETFGGAIASRLLGGAVIETAGEDRRVQP